MWGYFKKFFIFAGVFVGTSIVLSIITGLVLTYFYEEGGFTGHPLISTLINVISAGVAVLAAYKPFNKKVRYAGEIK
ncbi:hypothetical protein ACKA06_21320 [Rossellomorea oryzaecorticis]|uniref:Uncharacterized protein n=1 Tax=Rossellomorea oryzaecorticis TaxID=1396505 RepID=A0ABW8VV96_9BACI|nr:hypothetical protein [[Bacillus] enclensis]MBH9964690.1 hypothetical protein [[Bacillus] enclensis]OAT83848.1 hypothetical protein A6P54_00670 [Bacillus sp. MKU004]QTC43139.1 hypothetical protein I7V34_07845 [Bacillus sp. V3]QWC21317.1 hypothetical protein KJK41_13365 [Bacillus haikouensis]